MSGPTPDGGHLDLDAIAELDEGLTDPAVAQQQEQHLARCARCEAARARLRTTRALLSTMPAEPMPSDVAQRIDDALAGAGGTIVPTVLPKRRLWARHPSLAGLTAAAAVAGLVAAVAVGATHHSGNGNGSAGSASAPNGLLSPTPTRSPAVTTSGRDYTRQNALVLAPRLAREAAVPGGPPNNAAGVKPSGLPPALARLHGSPAAINACIAALNVGAPTPQQPLLIDYAKFEGKPAVLVLMPGIVPGHLDVWIVGPHCTAKDADVKYYASTLAAG